MKERSRGFISGVLASVITLSLIGTASATIGPRNITADYSDIKITLNGTEITPTDANGTMVEPFAVNGTTYLPVRAVGNALGLDVQWNGTTSTVLLSGVTGNGWLTSRDAINFAGDTLEADAFKTMADMGRQIQAVAQEMFAGEILMTMGSLSSDSKNEIIRNAKENVSSLHSNIEREGAIVNIVYAENSTMNAIIANLESGITALETASTKMGRMDSTFTDYYGTALDFASSVMQQADEAYHNVMDSMRQTCYSGSPSTAIEAITDKSSTQVQTNRIQNTGVSSRDTEESSSTNNASVDMNTQYTADRAALDAEHRAEMERLQEQRDEAYDTYIDSFYGKKTELDKSMAEQNYNGAEKAIKDAEEEYNQKLEELNEKYGASVDMNTQYAADRAALDAEHRAETERLQEERDEAYDTYIDSFHGKKTELDKSMAEQNYNGAEKAIKDAEEEYNQKLEELNEKYGI